MANVALIRCPKCEKRMRVPLSLAGKKIRCKDCLTTFAIKAPRSEAGQPTPDSEVSEHSAANAEAPIQPSVAEEQPASPSPAEEEDSETGYGLVAVDLSPRCPNCADKLEEENQVICLNCGYNLRTRSLAEAKTIYQPTGGEIFLWLLPGVLCLIGVIGLITLCVFVYMNAKEWFTGSFLDNGDGTWIIRPGILPLYTILFCLGVGIPMGRFAVKRLILNYRPPERIKR